MWCSIVPVHIVLLEKHCTCSVFVWVQLWCITTAYLLVQYTLYNIPFIQNERISYVHGNLRSSVYVESISEILFSFFDHDGWISVCIGLFFFFFSNYFCCPRRCTYTILEGFYYIYIYVQYYTALNRFYGFLPSGSGCFLTYLPCRRH